MKPSPSASLSLLLGLLALLSVNMISQIPAVEGATCFHIIFTIICDKGDPNPACLPTCKDKCGPSAGATCIDQVGYVGPICSCSFEAPDCTTQHVCKP